MNLSARPRLQVPKLVAGLCVATARLRAPRRPSKAAATGMLGSSRSRAQRTWQWQVLAGVCITKWPGQQKNPRRCSLLRTDNSARGWNQYCGPEERHGEAGDDV